MKAFAATPAYQFHYSELEMQNFKHHKFQQKNINSRVVGVNQKEHNIEYCVKTNSYE